MRALPSRTAVALALVLGGTAPAQHADAHPRGGFHRPGGGFHGGGGRPAFRAHGRGHVFIGGGVFVDPFPFLPYPFYVPYPYPVWTYPPPGEPEPEWGSAPPETAEEDDDARRAEGAPEDARRASYGLVRLRGVPDGASVDLDGQFWLTAEDLDERWLALPRGAHTLAVRVRGSPVQERRIDVKAGETQVVRFGPFRGDAG